MTTSAKNHAGCNWNFQHGNGIHSLLKNILLLKEHFTHGNINLPLHADLLDLISGQSVLETVPQEDDEGQALPQLVRTGGGTRGL